MIRNSSERYGWIAILLHWIMAVLVLGMFMLGLYMVELTYYDRLYNSLPFVHKSIGILQVPLFVFWLYWRLSNPSPRSLAVNSRFGQVLAKLVHSLFFLLLALILFSGYLIPTANGSAISVFGLISVPASITSIPQQADYAGLVHKFLSYGMIAMVLVHAAAALKHHVIHRDQTLRRMLGLLQ